MLAACNGPWPGARAERLHTGQAVLVACVAGCSACWRLWRATRQGIGVSCPFHFLPPPTVCRRAPLGSLAPVTRSRGVLRGPGGRGSSGPRGRMHSAPRRNLRRVVPLNRLVRHLFLLSLCLVIYLSPISASLACFRKLCEVTWNFRQRDGHRERLREPGPASSPGAGVPAAGRTGHCGEWSPVSLRG